jgi:hypothetical protein
MSKYHPGQQATRKADANATAKSSAKLNLQAIKIMCNKFDVSFRFGLFHKIMRSTKEFAENKIVVFINNDFQSWKYYRMSEIHNEFGAYPVEEVIFARIIFHDYWLIKGGCPDLPKSYLRNTLLDKKDISSLMPKEIVCFYILNDEKKGLQAMNLIFSEPIEKRKQVFENNLIYEYIDLL